MSAKTSRCLFICSLKRLSMLFVVLSPLILNAQPNRYLDSLHQLVETTDDDSAKLRGLSRLIIAYEDSAPSKALTFAEKALVLTAKMKSQFLQAVIHNQYGAVSMNTGQLEDAQKHFLAADSLFRLEGRLDRLGDVYLNLGSVIAQQEQYPKARGYMKQAIDIYKEEEDLPRVGIAQGLVGLSYVYQDSLTKGIGYLRQSYRQAKSLGVPQLQITPVTNLGFAYLKQHKNDSALVWIAIGKRLSDSLKSQSEFLTNLNNEASVYENQKRYAQSIAVAKEGEALAVKWGFPNKQIELLETLHLAYAGAAQKDLAYAVLTRYQTLKDSLDGVSEAEQIAELDARFQNQQQRYQIERLEDEQAASDSQMRIILIAAAIVIALLALVAFLARRSAFQRRKANALLVQQTEQLQQLDETKSRFFANLSHELRTPLSLILGPLQEAEKDEAIQADPGLHKHLHLARQNTEKLLQLVNEIMELSSLEAGKASLHLSDFNLQDMLKRCFYAFESSASLDQIRLVVDDKTAEPLWVKGDAVKLEKVLNNLVSNALKHSPKGSQIILEISKVNDRLEIAVQDAGPGIHPDDIPHVFERFFQSNQPGIPIQGGTGIGLALCRELVSLMGGDIGLESEVGQGSRFRIKLPFVPGVPTERALPTTSAELVQEETLSVPATTQGTILIVEDNKDMAEFLETLLCTTYTVHSARDGVEALAILEQEKIELLISDVMMPRMDGFELVEHVKGHAQLNSLATILLTARSLEADRLHGLRIGVDDYITKPFSPDELRARVANLLGNSRARHTFDEYTHSPQIESHDAALLSKAEQFVIAQLDNSKLKVSDLAEALAVSERQVFRLIKKLTGLSPVHFIREIRLRTARSLLEQKAFSSIAEVAYHCGFENPSYFARLFHERYGVRPSAL